MPPPRPVKGTHIDFPPALHDALRLAAFNARLPIAEVVRRACAGIAVSAALVAMQNQEARDALAHADQSLQVILQLMGV